MNGNMQLGKPVDGKKRKKYKSKLWSDIVDEYEEDMRKEKTLQEKLLENVTVPSVDKCNQKPENSKKCLTELWSEIVDEYEAKIKSITTHKNSVGKDSPTSVDKGIKSDETLISSMTSEPKTIINVEALRINPPKTQKLSVDPIIIDKSKKESIIIKESPTEKEYVTSSDKDEKSAEQPTILKSIVKNTLEQSSVDLRVSFANNATKQNKCKGKNMQKDKTKMAQKSENISLTTTKICDNANALNNTTIQTSIPEIKTSGECLKKIHI